MSQTVPDRDVASDAPGWRAHWKTGSPAWWTWLAIAGLLLATLSGVPGARGAALLLSALQAAVYMLRHRRLSHFPTQVRVAYLAWMLLSFAPGATAMLWIQALGTSTLVTVGYCPLARLLLFLPPNRTVPLTARRALRILFHPPTTGSVQEELGL